MLCLSLTRSHCLFISIHLRLSHIAVIAVVAATLLSPSPLPLPPHKLSPLQPPPLPPPLPPSPLRRLLPLPSPVGCCLSRVPIYPSITMSQSRFLQEEAVSNGLLVHPLLRPQIKVTMRTMMLPMLRRDCLGWLPSKGSLQTCWRGMELKGVLTCAKEDDNEYGW